MLFPCVRAESNPLRGYRDEKGERNPLKGCVDKGRTNLCSKVSTHGQTGPNTIIPRSALKRLQGLKTHKCLAVVIVFFFQKGAAYHMINYLR